MVTAAHVWFLLQLHYFKLQRQYWLMQCNCNEELIVQLASNANDVLRVTMRVISKGRFSVLQSRYLRCILDVYFSKLENA
jgi:hypothetical protein